MGLLSVGKCFDIFVCLSFALCSFPVNDFPNRFFCVFIEWQYQVFSVYRCSAGVK